MLTIMRVFLALLLALFAVTSDAQILRFSGKPVPSGDPDFTRVLKIGAGGWVTGIHIASDGQKIIRTDTGGGYIWNSTTSHWDQLATQTRMPGLLGYIPSTGTEQVRISYDGVYAIAQADSDTSIIWVAFLDRMYKSTDRGLNFTQSTDFGNKTMMANGDYRMNGRKMAIDPQNPDHVIIGTDLAGAWRTTNGGTNWALTDDVPVGVRTTFGDERKNHSYNIAFDPASGLCSGRTCVIYLFTHTGSTTSVWRSADGGESWTATSGGPNNLMQRMVVAPTGGIVWAVAGYEGGPLWKYEHGIGWTEKYAGTFGHSVSVNPTDAKHIVFVSPAGSTVTSTDGGNTWSAEQGFTNAATDVPWLGTTNSGYHSNGDTAFDPSACSSNTTCKLYLSAGIGVWNQVNFPTSGNFVWTSQNAGIEQLVVRDVIAPNGVAIVGNSDRATFVLPTPDVYPSNAAQSTYRTAFALAVTWQHNWASSDSNFIVARTASIDGVTENSGYSADGGATNFKPFSGWYREGIAASALSNNGSGNVRVTVDDTTGLTSWSNGSGSIVRMMCSDVTGVSGFVSAVYLSRQSFPITVVNGTTVDLQNSTWDNFLASGGGTCQLYEDWTPMSDNAGSYKISGIENDGTGKIKINIAQTNYGLANYSRKVCITGVTGTTEANGCWAFNNGDNSINSNGGRGSMVLYGSTFTNAYIGGGTMKVAIPPGGGIAASTPNNIVIYAANQDRLQCTTDGGQNWTTLNAPADETFTLNSASWSSNLVTLNTSGGRYRETVIVTGATPSAYNGTYHATTGSWSQGIGSGTITNGGSGYTNGSYSNVQIQGGSAWPPALANVTISGGAVTAVTITFGGIAFTAGQTAGFISLGDVGGGGGSGFVYTVNTLSNRIVAEKLSNPGTYTSGGTVTPAGVESGFSNASYLNRLIVAADRVTANKFYAYNYLYGTYTWSNCDTPTLASTTTWSFSGFNARLHSVPGYAGHLLGSSGPQGNEGGHNPGGTMLKWSNDGGVTWYDRGDVLQPMAIGLGAIKPGSDYPTVIIAGWVGLDYGIWRTTSTAAQWAANTITWEKLSTFPDGWTGTPTTVSGSGTDWRMWYMGAASIGYWYGRKSYLMDNDNQPAFLNKAA